MASDEVPEEHYLLESSGTKQVTYDFVQVGMKHNTLTYIHGMRDYRGVVCHTYRIVED